MPRNFSQPNRLFIDKIESVQYNAALAITGCIRGTSNEKLYNELGITSLYNRRTFHRLLYFYKIKNNLLPGYLKNEIPEDIPHLHDTRHHRDCWITTRTNKYKYSFFPHSVNAWSSLSNLVKSSPSVGIFKRRYMDFYQVTAKPTYGIHNPVGLRYLSRLRVGLSHLRKHKFNHHFDDTENPYCNCDNVSLESVEHYFLRCPKHTLSRVTLFENLISIIGLIYFKNDSCTTEILLYGKDSLHPLTNKKIIESTINFILNSSRFSEPLLVGQSNSITP